MKWRFKIASNVALASVLLLTNSQNCCSASEPDRPKGLPVTEIATTNISVTNHVIAGSDPEHMVKRSKKPQPWPGGIIPYDMSKLTPEQQAIVERAIKRWQETGAQISFVPHTSEAEYVYFTGDLTAGNNTSLVGYQKGARAEINITAFWWRQQEWMIAHELGHVLGFFHEHQRWDRDNFITVHYENIKPGRSSDYDWIPRTNWVINSTPYDYRSIMHYRICWASKCESECRDGVGSSPCCVIAPVDTNFDRVIGQWGDNRISDLDAEKVRLVYGMKTPRDTESPSGPSQRISTPP